MSVLRVIYSCTLWAQLLKTLQSFGSCLEAPTPATLTWDPPKRWERLENVYISLRVAPLGASHTFHIADFLLPFISCEPENLQCLHYHRGEDHGGYFRHKKEVDTH